MATVEKNNQTNGGLIESEEIIQDSRNLVRTVLYASALVVGLVLSVFGNALTLIAIAMHRTLRTRKSCFIVNLALADFLNGATTFPLMVAAVIHGEWPFTQAVCSFQGSLTIIFCTASILTLAFVAIDRYFAIVNKLKYVRKVTPTFLTICVTYSWLEPICLAIMPNVGWSHYEYIPGEYLCTADWTIYSYTIFIFTSTIGLSVLVILYCYVWVFKVARDQSRKVAEHALHYRGHPANRRETRTAKILFVVITTFSICWFPHSVIMFCSAFTQNMCPIPATYHALTVLLAMTNSAMNPILYGVLNRRMRRAYYNVLRVCFSGHPKIASLSLTE